MDQCEWANGTDEKTGWNAKIVVIFSIWKIYRSLVSAFRHTSYFVRIFFLSSPIASSHLTNYGLNEIALMSMSIYTLNINTLFFFFIVAITTEPFVFGSSFFLPPRVDTLKLSVENRIQFRLPIFLSPKAYEG